MNNFDEFPRPWRIGRIEEPGCWGPLDALVDAEGNPVVLLLEVNEETRPALEHICRIVNAHDALVEACRNAERIAWRGRVGTAVSKAEYVNCWRGLKAALELAEERNG